jgi:hypothetical protein
MTAVWAVITACVFAAVGDHGMPAGIHWLGDAWLRLMSSGRALLLTAVAKVFQCPRARMRHVSVRHP